MFRCRLIPVRRLPLTGLSGKMIFDVRLTCTVEINEMVLACKNRLVLIIVIACLSIMGCTQRPAASISEARSEQAQPPSEPSTAQTIPREDGSSEQDFPALHHLLQVTDSIYTGGEPDGAEAFSSLVRLGVKTVVSVDGAIPDVETARKYGLRYVHIPFGYDGVDQEAGLAIASVVRNADGPFYFHCHHGIHRGPAAAAIACVASGDISGKSALKILERAGTGKDYAGLWRDVESYQPPSVDAQLPELVEIAEIGTFAAAMARIDRALDNLKFCQDANWSAPASHPDLVPSQEALLLRESLHESSRNLADGFGDEFKSWLAEAESTAQHLEDSLRANNTDEVSGQFESLQESCKKCHKKFRN